MKTKSDVSRSAVICLQRFSEELEHLDTRAREDVTFDSARILYVLSELHTHVCGTLDEIEDDSFKGTPSQEPVQVGDTGCWDALQAAVRTYRNVAERKIERR